MRRRRHLPTPALLEIDEQTFWEKYRPIVEPAEGQVIRGPEHLANLTATTLWTVVDTGESETLYALPDAKWSTGWATWSPSGHGLTGAWWRSTAKA